MSLYRSLSIQGALATSEFGKIDRKLVLSFFSLSSLAPQEMFVRVKLSITVNARDIHFPSCRNLNKD